MNTEYNDIINEVQGKTQTSEANLILESFLNNTPNSDTPFETLYSILNKGFFKTFPSTYMLRALLFSMLIFIVLKLIQQMLKNSKHIGIIKFFAFVCVSTVTLIPGYKIIASASLYMRDISTFLGVIFPTLGILTASGGNVILAKNTSVFFSLWLSVSQFILNTFVPFVSLLFLGLAIIDVFLGENKFLSITIFIKNSIFGAFSIGISFFYIVLSVFGQAAKGSDSISARTLKLMIGNAIPIIGSTVGEAIKFAASGILNLKNMVGVSSVIFILALFLPILISFFGSGIILNLIKCLCDYFNIYELRNLTLHIKSMFDFTLAAFSALTIAAIVNINVFLSAVPTVI